MSGGNNYSGIEPSTIEDWSRNSITRYSAMAFLWDKDEEINFANAWAKAIEDSRPAKIYNFQSIDKNFTHPPNSDKVIWFLISSIEEIKQNNLNENTLLLTEK